MPNQTQLTDAPQIVHSISRPEHQVVAWHNRTTAEPGRPTDRPTDHPANPTPSTPLTCNGRLQAEAESVRLGARSESHVIVVLLTLEVCLEDFNGRLVDPFVCVVLQCSQSSGHVTMLLKKSMI